MEVLKNTSKMHRQKLGKNKTHFVCQKEYYLHKNTSGAKDGV